MAATPSSSERNEIIGLDNIPNEYPCIRRGTAIIAEDEADRPRIDCDATIAAGQCPWREQATNRGTPVYGMFGVPCWYRGKAGTWMLTELEEVGYEPPPDGFYGDGGAEPNLSPEYCIELATWMEDHAEAYANLHGGDEDGGKDAIENYRYAAWWLRFMATEADGAQAWY